MHLMRLHAQCGDRASVARAYKTCVTVLEQELGVEPGQATMAAYQKYISQEIQWIAPQSQRTPEILSRKQITHNLPAPLNSLIGRDQEISQVCDLLSTNRLVTLIGPGGIGKTRLALTAAGKLILDFRDGVFLVDLAPITDSKNVILAIADALQAGDGVRAAGLEGLKDYLGTQNLLLLMDNCEHLVEEVGRICQALLPSCSRLTILATSREALKIYGETLWQVPALLTPVWMEKSSPGYEPMQVGVLRNNESVQLFIERATSALPTFQTSNGTLFFIGEICRRLEGMPLAIEMAAVRVRTFSVQQIVQRLDRATDLLQHPSSGNTHRHSTMEAVMDWSYSLLPPVERRLFTRLGVFSGTFSLEAVEEVCQGRGFQKKEIIDLLASLVDKSMVSLLPTIPEARFRLHEIVRQYAHQKLNDSGRFRYWKDRHLDYFVHMAEDAEPGLRGSEQLEYLNRLELELENIRSALQYSLENESDAEEQEHHSELAARMVGALWIFWFIRGRFSEGRRWAELALALLERNRISSPMLGKVLNTAASFCYFQSDYLSGRGAVSKKFGCL